MEWEEGDERMKGRRKGGNKKEKNKKERKKRKEKKRKEKEEPTLFITCAMELLSSPLSSLVSPLGGVAVTLAASGAIIPPGAPVQLGGAMLPAPALAPPIGAAPSVCSVYPPASTPTAPCAAIIWCWYIWCGFPYIDADGSDPAPPPPDADDAGLVTAACHTSKFIISSPISHQHLLSINSPAAAAAVAVVAVAAVAVVAVAAVVVAADCCT